LWEWLESCSLEDLWKEPDKKSDWPHTHKSFLESFLPFFNVKYIFTAQLKQNFHCNAPSVLVVSGVAECLLLFPEFYDLLQIISRPIAWPILCFKQWLWISINCSYFVFIKLATFHKVYNYCLWYFER
jgi:hypothetical protein